MGHNKHNHQGTERHDAATAPNGSETAAKATREQISRRAYELSRGKHGGSDMQNWLQAEREVRQRSADRPVAPVAADARPAGSERPAAKP
jgi:hypothetical protein